MVLILCSSANTETTGKVAFGISMVISEFPLFKKKSVTNNEIRNTTTATARLIHILFMRSPCIHNIYLMIIRCIYDIFFSFINSCKVFRTCKKSVSSSIPVSLHLLSLSFTARISIFLGVCSISINSIT